MARIKAFFVFRGQNPQPSIGVFKADGKGRIAVRFAFAANAVIGHDKLAHDLAIGGLQLKRKIFAFQLFAKIGVVTGCFFSSAG